VTVVIVQHRVPDAERLLSGLLQQWTVLTICEPEDKNPLL